MKEKGELLEHAQVYGHWYGVPWDQVRHALLEGRDVLIKADVQGAATIQRLMPQALLIFLASASLEDLKARGILKRDAVPSRMGLPPMSPLVSRESRELLQLLGAKCQG